MTIALGILTRDGVVVAADSQETVKGYWKGDQGKLSWAGYYGDFGEKPGRSAGVCIVSGSGRSTYTDALAVDLLRRFSKKPTAVSNDDVETLIGDAAREFHVKHVAPYKDASELEVRMIAGYYRNNHHGLYSTDIGVVFRHALFAAVGIGDLLAKSILKQLFNWRTYNVESAIRLAAYVVFQAKQQIDGCGNFTDIMYARNNVQGYIPRTTVEALEKEFGKYSSLVETPILRYMLGNVNEVPTVSASAEQLRKDILQVPIVLTEGFTTLDPTEPAAPTPPKRGRKGRTP